MPSELQLIPDIVFWNIQVQDLFEEFNEERIVKTHIYKGFLSEGKQCKRKADALHFM